MLVDNIFEAVQWAHRYCIDYQTKSNNITKVFYKEFVTHIAPTLSSQQADHLYEDVKRFIAERKRLMQFYPEIEIPQVVYDYNNLLSNLEGTDEKYFILPQETLFKFIYWACEYCITRHSYAGSYGKDAVQYLPQFSSEQLRFLKNQLDTRIKEAEARNAEFSTPFSEVVDQSWYHLRRLLETWDSQSFYEITVKYDNKEESAICFEDNNKVQRIVSEFFANPYVPCYFNPELITEIKQAEGHRNIKGELDEEEF